MNTMTMDTMTTMPMMATTMKEIGMPMMPVHEPAELYERFAAALNAADLDGVMALFDPEDVLRYVRQGDGPVLELHIGVHMTLNANGEITTEFEDIHFECGS